MTSNSNEFIKSKIIESYAKQIITKDINGNDQTQKFMYFSILLKATSDVPSFAFDITPLGGNVNPINFLSLLTEAGYADNLTDIQLTNIKGAVDENNISLYHPLAISEGPQIGDYMYLDINDSDNLVVPYNRGITERVYRLVLNITSYDGSNSGNPDIRAIWKDSPLKIYLNADNVALNDRALLDLNIEIIDCQDDINKLIQFINDLQVTDDATYGITADDITFLTNIINGTTGKSSDPNACVPPGYTLPELPIIQSYPDYSLMYEISNLDKLICYLRNQVIKYKSDINIVGGAGTCYGYVKCLIKSWVGLTKLYHLAVARMNAINQAASVVIAQYTRIKTEYQDSIEAARGIRQSITSWIQNNLDANFDTTLESITCSNNIGTDSNAIAFSNTIKYNKYYVQNNQRINTFIDYNN